MAIDATSEADADARADGDGSAAPSASPLGRTSRVRASRAFASPDASADASDTSARDAQTEIEPEDPGPGPAVDRAARALTRVAFTVQDADPDATPMDTSQQAIIDTRVPSRGRLVVLLHGGSGGAPCGAVEHQRLLASWGFHTLGVCYPHSEAFSACADDDSGACRLEAVDGRDRTDAVRIRPADSIEVRVVRALSAMQRVHPDGDWTYFVDGGRPRWGAIVLSGHGDGAALAAAIGATRSVSRVVLLSGPFEPHERWLSTLARTPRARYWSFSHGADATFADQSATLDAMRVSGPMASVEELAAPFGGSQRLATRAPSVEPASATQAGLASPRSLTTGFRFAPVWRLLYGAP